ncbi:MAG: hypothetical protein WKG07_21460 [Hymenobacter sp.]
MRNLVLKTLKMLPYAADEKQELMNLSANWQDDRDFAETLYKQTLADDAKSVKLIADSTPNWDVDRVALLDKIILQDGAVRDAAFPRHSGEGDHQRIH